MNRIKLYFQLVLSLIILLTLTMHGYAANEGTIKWTFNTSYRIVSSPAIAPDSTLYIGSLDKKVYAINPDGTKKWEFTTGGMIQSSPVIGNDGTVYIASNDNQLYALDRDGKKKWVFITQYVIDASPAIGSDGTIYVGSGDSKLYALNPDGTQKWDFKTNGRIVGISIGLDGTIYSGSGDGKLYSIHPDGIKKWAFITGPSSRTGNYYVSSPAVASDGTIYVGAADKYLYAIKPDGTKKWAFQTGDMVSSPAIGADGTIYVGSNDNYLYAINPNGTKKWSVLTGYWVQSSPAIGTDGSVYVGSYDNKLYAIYSNSKGLAKTPWPKYGKDMQNRANSVDRTYPVASIKMLTKVLPNEPFILDGSESIDIDGGNLNYQWQITSSTGIKDDIVIESPNDKISNCIIKGYGSYFIQLKVWDDQNQISYAQIEVLSGLVWIFTADSDFESSPAINSDGTIYLGNSDNNFYAINPDGTKKWEFKTGKMIKSTPAIGADGTLYVVSVDGNLYAIDPKGAKKWVFYTGAYQSSPAIGSDGTIYVGSSDTKIYAINSNGTQKWAFKTGHSISSSPAIGVDGTVYVGSLDNKLYAINPDGTEKWTFITGGQIYSSPSIGADGTIYVGSYDQKLYAVNLDGTQKWAFPTNQVIDTSPAIGPDGTIYLGGYKKLYGIDVDGVLKWTFNTAGDNTSPMIDSEGTIYVGSLDNNLYAITPDGKTKWVFNATSFVYTCPAIGTDGTIYFGTEDHKLYALYTTSHGLAKAPWPKFHKDLNNSGNSSIPGFPIARVNAPTNVLPKIPFVLDGSGSYDIGGNNLTYLWQVVSSTSQVNEVEIESPNSASTNCIIKGYGRFLIRLKILDDQNYCNFASIEINSGLLWAFKASFWIKTSCAIGRDGTIYSGSESSNFYAINPDGTQKWVFKTINGGFSSPVISSDGIIYVGSSDKLIAINSDGTQKWTFKTGYSFSSPAIGSDGTIYVASSNKNLYAFNPDGNPRWTFNTGCYFGSPVIGVDGTIYVGANDKKLYAIYPDGTPKWVFNTGGEVYSPAIGSDGTIYVASSNKNLYALNPDGNPRWTFNTGYYLGDAIIGGDGTIYVGSYDKKLYAINPNGTQKWVFNTGGGILSSPAIGSDGIIYVGTLDKKMYAINPDGTESWVYTTDGEIYSSPAISSDGTIYFGSNDNKLYAISSTSRGVDYSAPWPKYHKDLQNSSNGSIAGFPIIHIKPVNSVMPGVPFTLDGSDSHDNDSHKLNFSWQVIKGTTSIADVVIESPGSIVTNCIIKTYGTYTIQLKIWDEQNHINISSVEISAGTKWKYKTDGMIKSSPAIGSDSTIYFGSDDKKVYAINRDGSKKWIYSTNDMIASSPAIASDGTIYIGSDDNRLYAINVNGSLKWDLSIGYDVKSCPAIDTTGNIYVTDYGGSLLAFNPTGTLLWRFDTGNNNPFSPVIGTDGSVIVASYWDGKLYALNPNGKIRWVFTISSLINSSPAIGADGTIYIGSRGNKFFAISQDGTQKWIFGTSGAMESSPAIGEDGTIYVGSNDKKLYAINRDGTQKWTFTTGGAINSSPAIGSDGVIYIGSTDNNFYAINPDGTLRWAFKTGDAIISSPNIADDGTVYVGSNDNTLYAFYSSSNCLASSAWPKFRHDEKNSGFARCVPDSFSALFKTDKTEGVVPLKIEFNNQSVGEIEQYQWNFGDGYTSNDKNVVHTYETPGIYTVSLIIIGATENDTLKLNKYIHALPLGIRGPVEGTWTKNQSPIIVGSNIFIPPSKELIIEPGVKVLFSAFPDSFFKLIVHGKVSAKGSISDSIFFSSADDSLAPGSWGGIEFINPSDTSSIEFAKITKSKNAISYQCATKAGGLGIKDCRIEYNEFDGINLSAFEDEINNISVTNSIIRNNGKNGISCVSEINVNLRNISSNRIAPLIKKNIISNNGGDGIHLNANGGFAVMFSNDIPSRFSIAETSPIIEQNIIATNEVNGVYGEVMGLALKVFGMVGYTKGILAPCIKKNLILENQHSGMFFEESNTPAYQDPNMVIYNNTMWGNKRIGVETHFYEIEKDKFTIINNIIAGSDSGLAQFHGRLEATVAYNDFFANTVNITGFTKIGEISTANRYGTPSDSSNNIFVNPLFCDISSNDFNLYYDSPCIDAGLNIGESYSGKAPDIGSFESSSFTGVHDEVVVSGYQLENNYPNPFNSETKIHLRLPERSFVTLEIYNVRGERVTTLLSKVVEQGQYEVIWDGKDSEMNTVGSGIYFIRFNTEKYCEIKATVFIK